MAQLLTRWERQGMRRGLEQGREEGREQGREEGREQGLEQGRAEGLSIAILRLLDRKGIALDAATGAHIRGLRVAALLDLAEAVLDFQGRADLDAWLAQRGHQGE